MGGSSNFESYRTITLPAQIGGPDAAAATQPHLIVLSKLLWQHCPGPYSNEVSEFALIFRIDGKFQEFGGDGCERLRRSFKDHYITLDICIPEHRWKEVDPHQVRCHLNEMVKQALQMCVARLKRDKAYVDEVKLFADYAKVEGEFLGA